MEIKEQEKNNKENKNLSCPFTEIEIKDDREIVYTDNLKFPYHQDSNGYFLVKINNNMINCGFVNSEHKMIIEFRGKNPDKIIKEITRRNLCSRETLAYISQELMIAYYCLVNNKPYVQR